MSLSLRELSHVHTRLQAQGGSGDMDAGGRPSSIRAMWGGKCFYRRAGRGILDSDRSLAACVRVPREVTAAVQICPAVSSMGAM